MADFSTGTPVPGLTTAYTSVLSIINDKFTDLARGLDTSPATNPATATNIPINGIAWNNATSKWRKWDGSAWQNLSDSYAINISGNAATATSATSAVSVSGTVAIANGGTGATTAAAARTALGLTTAATTALSSGTGATGILQIAVDGVVDTSRYIDFHAVGGDAVDYTVRLDGGAAGSTTLNLFGSFSASGNVTAYSDERLKIDWLDVSSNFVQQLAELKSGTYTRIDSGERQAGVSAQSLQKLLPETVVSDDSGHLSVAYGNAALVACVELAREIKALRAEITQLKQA